MWEVPLETQKSEIMGNKILTQTTKPELVQCIHAALFTPIIVILLKEIKQVLLKNFPVLTEKLIKKHIEKSMNTTMDHLNMIRKGLQSTREKPSDTDL